jgi:tetratricopeptide (TPR) repeat protein
MIPGRNDPCPCGSGKKYKKCCLGEAPTTPATTVAQPATKSTPLEAEPRFCPAVTLYCTQAALAEALKPGGMVYIHPYVLIKLRDDPRLIESAKPQERAGLLRSWRASTVSAMATDEIEERLTQLGVPYAPARFREMTRGHDSAWDIAEEWSGGLPALSPADRDFLGLAACELWRRRVPEHPSLEMIDDWVCEGYAYLARKNPEAALAAWWRAWEALRSRLTAEMKDMQDADEEIFPHMSQCLSNWCMDFRLEAVNGALKDCQCGEIGIRFIQEVLARLPEEDEDLNLSGDLGTLYFAVGRDAEAEQCCQQLIRTHPDRAAGYVILSSELLHRFQKGLAGQDQLRRGVQLLEQALAYPVKDPESFDVPARLARARELLSPSRRPEP